MKRTLRAAFTCCILGLALSLTMCGGSDSGSGESTSIYTLSAEQAAMVAKYGNPEYLSVSVNNASGRREESWTYSAALGKMIVFWDGARVKEKAVAPGGGSVAKAPFVDPTLFGAGITKSKMKSQFGSNYQSLNQSDGALKFETWYFETQGISVSFSSSKLVAVQTVDKV